MRNKSFNNLYINKNIVMIRKGAGGREKQLNNGRQYWQVGEIPMSSAWKTQTVKNNANLDIPYKHLEFNKISDVRETE